MKKLFITLAIAFVAIFTNAQSMKVVVDAKNNPMGIYVSETSKTYTVSLSDDIDIPKKGYHVVTYRASAGQGIIHPYSEYAHTGPGKSYSKFKIYIMDMTTYKCLGVENGWYKIKANGKIGYLHKSECEWCAIDRQNGFISERVNKVMIR